MTKAAAKEQNIERQIQKQMGCMAGFLQIFDRHHLATTNRLYSARSLPSSPATEMTTTSESEKSAPPSPPPAESILPTKSKVPILTALNAGAAKPPWKLGKEAPRLSLDSRAVTDSKGCLRPKAIRTTANADDSSAAAADENEQHHRSPSVIARLMGLEPLPPLAASTVEPELRRCASDSRAAKDLFFARFEEFNSNLSSQASFDADPSFLASIGKDTKQSSAAKFQLRKCFFDSGDIFPEPKKMNVGHDHGELMNKLRMRGLIDQPSNDLETLRQILEALQLKGLLHSRNQIEHRNFVYDESPMAVVKSTKPPAYSTPANGGRFGSCYSPRSNRSQPRRSYGASGEISPSISPRRERNTSSPVRSGGRNEGNRRSNSLVKPKPLSVDIQRRRVNEVAENRRVSPINSPRLNSRPGNNRSPRCKKPTAEIYLKEKKASIAVTAEDESSSTSDYSYSTSTDTERSKTEEYKDGKNILEGSAKLLRSIAEMTSSTDMQPSPVSVLDSSFYKDESFTPSPVTTRRHIELKGEGGVEDEPWSPAISPIRTKQVESSQDQIDHAYISDILRASHYLSEHSDVFSLLEKQQYVNGIEAKLQRKLTFDVVSEIMERNKRMPPWKAISLAGNDSFDNIWSEFRRLRDRSNPEDLFETICVVLKEDLAGDALNGWRDCYVEMSHSILDIERMIFKDLISDAIRDLASSARSNVMVISSPSSWPRRKLVF